MTRKIDPEKARARATERVTTHRAGSSRPPKDWPGIPGRSEDDEADFARRDGDDSPAQVTQAQRELERTVARREPEE